MASKTNNAYLLFDVGGTFLKGFIAGSDCRLIEETEFSVPMPSSGTREEIIGSLETAVSRGALLASERGLQIAGVALDFPGPFDYNAGVSLMEHKFQAIHSLCLTDVIKAHEAIADGVPVRFMHDVNAALLGEKTLGNGQGYRNVAIVTLGTGLGFACSLNDELQENQYGSPAISIFRRPCGDGILEDFVSKRGFTRLYHEAAGIADSDITVAEIAKKAFGGDEAAKKAFADAGRILGRAIAPILAENGIECLLFGGQISKSFELFAPALREELKDVATLQHIGPARNITAAPFYGLLASICN